MAKQISVEFGASIGRLLDGVDKVGSKLDGLARPIDALNNKFNGLIAGFGAALGGLSLAAFIRDVADTAVEFQTLQASLITVTGSAEKADIAFEGLKKFASTTPFSLQDVTTAFIKLKGLGLQPSEEALKSYGNTASAMGKSLNQFIEAIADAATGEFERLKEFNIKSSSQGDQVRFTFQGITTQVGKNTNEIEAYLRRIGQVQFAGAMERQSATLGGALSKLQRSFSVFKNEVAEGGLGQAIADLARHLSEATSGADNLANQLGSALGSVVRNTAEAIEGLLKHLREVSAVMGGLEGAKLGAAVGGLPGAAIGGLGGAAAGYYGTDYLLRDRGGGGAASMRETERAIERTKARIAELEQKAQSPFGNAYYGQELEAARRRLSQLEEAYKKTATAAGTLGDAAGPAPVKSDSGPSQAQLSEARRAAQELRAVAIQQVEDEIATERLKTEGQKGELDRQAQNRTISNAEYIAQSARLAASLEQFEEERIRKMLGRNDLTLMEQQKLDTRLLQLKIKHESDLDALNAEALSLERNKWKARLGPMNQAFSQSIQGIIQGTNTLKAAWNNMMQSILLTTVQRLGEMLTNWIATEAAKTTATQIGVAARGGSEEGGYKKGLAAQLGAAVKSIFTSAAKVYADVFAWAAPFMGPFAAIPAGIATAAVIGASALLPALATGTMEVPKDMVAMLHQGEMVVPKTFAQGLREGGGLGGGGQVVNIAPVYNISGTGDFISQLKNHDRELVRIITGALRDNPSLKPA